MSVDQGVQKRTLVRSIRVGPTALKFISLLILAGVFLLFGAMNGRTATLKYSQSSATQQRDELLKERDRLKAEADRLRTLREITTNQDGLVPTQ